MTAGDNKTLPERLLKEAREMPNLSEYEDGGANLRYWLRKGAAALEATEGRMKAAQTERDAARGMSELSHQARVRIEKERDEARGDLDNQALYTAEYLGFAQVAGKKLKEAEARLVAVEAERDEALTLVATLSPTEGGSDFTTRVLALNDDTLDAASAELDRVGIAGDLLLGDRVKVLAAEFAARAGRLIDAEARVAALEAENAELKRLKAGGDRVARAEADLLEAEIRAFLLDVRALVADHWSGCLPEREAAIAAAPYVDAQVFTEDVDPSYGPPLGPRDPDWLAPLLSLTAAVRPQTDTPDQALSEDAE